VGLEQMQPRRAVRESVVDEIDRLLETCVKH
jgi:hypothetical protein